MSDERGTTPEDLAKLGVKFDTNKPQMELLSPMWVEGVAKVLTFGAKKYSSHNWRKGIHQSRLIGAALRHLFAYLRGQNYDPETGLSHLAHASCCIMFAEELRETHPDLDDRYKGQGSLMDMMIHEGNYNPEESGVANLHQAYNPFDGTSSHHTDCQDKNCPGDTHRTDCTAREEATRP